MQFLASFRYRQPFALVDLALGLRVLGVSVIRLRQVLTLVLLIGASALFRSGLRRYASALS